ncbi:hypothetical protein ACX6GQ_002433 [Escherichia coli]|nr:hypothetical protein [Shigella flexneri]EJA5949888.1 hypothetical protein [Shigella sonnei]EJI1673347.1 hypothetical protein [Shigella flexneri]
MDEIRIRIAGNTAAPCFHVLKNKGYKVTMETHALSDDCLDCVYDWCAEKNGQFFSATSPEELLGLVAMWEVRGNDWRANLNEINTYQKAIEESPFFDKNGNEIESD